MPRRARIVIPGVPLHVMQRGNNRQDVFFTPDDRVRYLERLQALAPETGCALHAFVLMTNHVHLLLTPAAEDSCARLMKRLSQAHAQYINRTLGRTGTLWEGRFRSCLVEDERYLLTCQRYIELNPVRAGMVASPGDYPWSSHRANAGLEQCDYLTPHPDYLALGVDADQRYRAYRALFDQALDSAVKVRVRHALRSETVLGEPAFVERLSRRLGRALARRPRGRPARAGNLA